jgi:hypothetical protein
VAASPSHDESRWDDPPFDLVKEAFMKFSSFLSYAKHVTFLWALVILPELSYANDVHVEPSAPTDADSVLIVGMGCEWFATGCNYAYNGFFCDVIDAHTFRVQSYNVIDCTYGPCDCYAECIGPLELGRCNVGTLAAGHYDIQLYCNGYPAYPLSFDVTEAPTAVRTTPSSGMLTAVVPNPFTSNARVEFSMEKRARATLEVFDVRGSHVRTLIDKTMNAAGYTVEWDGRDANGQSQPSGVYFARLMVDGASAGSRRIVLLR